MNPRPLFLWVHALPMLLIAITTSCRCRAGAPAANQPAREDILKRLDAPKRASFDLRGATVEEALAKLQKEFGWEMERSGDDALKQTLDVAIKDATYFEALEAIRKAAKLGYEVPDRFDAITGEERAAKQIHIRLCKLEEKGFAIAVTKGPLLVFVDDVNLNREHTIVFADGKGKKEHSLNASANCLVEPDIPISHFEYAYKDGDTETTREEVRDYHAAGHGAFLAGVGSVHSVEEASTGPHAFEIKMKIKIPLTTDEKRFENLAAAKDSVLELAADSAVIVQHCKRNGENWEVAVKGRGKAENFVWNSLAHHFNYLQARNPTPIVAETPGLFFLDAKGVPISKYSEELDRKDGDPFKLLFAEEPKTLLVRHTAESTEREITVELKDVPVP